MTVRFSSADRSNRNTLANAPNDALIEGFLVSWIGIFDVLIHLGHHQREIVNFSLHLRITKVVNTLGAVGENRRIRYRRATWPRLFLRARNGLFECARFANITLWRPFKLALFDFLLDDTQLCQLLALLFL